MRILGRLAVAAGATAAILLASPAANAAPSVGNMDSDMPRSADLVGVAGYLLNTVTGGLGGGALGSLGGLASVSGLPGLG